MSSPPFFAAAAACIALVFVFRNQGYVHPPQAQTAIRNAAAGMTIFFSFLGLTLFPRNSLSVWVTSGVLLVLAVSAPVAGIIQRKLQPGRGIFRDGDQESVALNPAVIGTQDYLKHAPAAGSNEEDVSETGQDQITVAETMPWQRFIVHLSSNVIGAALVIMFLLSAAYWKQVEVYAVSPQLLADLVLPVSAYAILEFVRHEQLARCPRMDSYAEAGDFDSIDDDLRGYSLLEWHQFLNTMYLTAALFLAAGSVLVRLFTAQQAYQMGSPVPIDWMYLTTVVLALVFLGATALQSAPAVYTTFLWGAPFICGYFGIWFLMLDTSALARWRAWIWVLVALVVVGYLVGAWTIIRKRRSQQVSDMTLVSYLSRYAVVALVLGGLMFALFMENWYPTTT